MELNGNFSKLRKLVTESGNENLRQLESELLQSLANKLNHQAIISKEEKQKKEVAANAVLGSAVQQCTQMEVQRQLLLDTAAKERSTTLALYQQEQHHCRAIASSYQRCTEIAVDMALNKPKPHDKDKVTSERRAQASVAQEQLVLHRQHRAIADARCELDQRAQTREADEVACVQQLQRHVQQEQAGLQRVQYNRRLLQQGHHLDRQQLVQQEVCELRVAVATAELQEHQRLQHLEQQHQQQHLQQQQLQHWEQQIIDKSEAEQREKRQEAEYLKILHAVQSLECDLALLSSAARKRRLLQQRDETDRLLQVRAVQRRKKRLELARVQEQQRQHSALSAELSGAEEHSLLMQFAPHLLPHLTPALYHRLTTLHTTRNTTASPPCTPPPHHRLTTLHTTTSSHLHTNPT